MKYNNEYYIEKKYGFLTILSYEHSKFLCRCDCGNEILISAEQVATGKRKSCGDKNCLYYKKAQSDSKRTHGLSKTRLYIIWHNMIARCYYPKYQYFNDYGGRGIKVCEEWKSDVLTFIHWANDNGYEDNLTIDRINNNGNYEPSNCRWVSMSIQNCNKRENKNHEVKKCKHIWTIGNETKKAIEWCKFYNISFPTVIYRIKKYNLSPFQALTLLPYSNEKNQKEKSNG